MSRRSHRHGPAHARPHRPEGSHQAAPATRAAPVVPVVEPGPHETAGSTRPESAGSAGQVRETVVSETVVTEAVVTEAVVSETVVADLGAKIVAVPAPASPRPMAVASVDPGPAPAAMTGGDAQLSNQAEDAPIRTTTCTTAQLRQFIKSRAYMPMHELRRRFLINGSEDDVTRVEVDGGAVFVGLPEREGRMLGDLLRGGEVGYELSHDPVSPIVVGVFPMRPIPRA